MKLLWNVVGLSVPLAGTLAVALTGACSGEETSASVDGSPSSAPRVDAGRTPDGGAGQAEPDGAPPSGARVGTVEITDVEVTNDSAGDVGGLSGARVDIDFEDLATATVEPVFGGGSDGACTVYAYDLADGEAPPEVIDGGAVAVTGTNAGSAEEGGFSCGFAGGEYTCILGEGQDVTITAEGEANSFSQETAEITLDGVDLDDPAVDVAGAHIELGGFIDIGDGDQNESELNGIYDVAEKASASSVRIVFDEEEIPLLTGFRSSFTTPTDGGSYKLTVGDGPIQENFDFLSGGATIQVSKDAHNGIPGVDVDVTPPGDGLTLADGDVGGTTYVLPDAFPTTRDTAANFGCNPTTDDGVGGTCGATSDSGENTFIVSGRTTDAAIAEGAALSDMPEPQTAFARFTCVTRDRSRTGSNAITIPPEAVGAILDTDPTRIETRVTYASEVSVDGGVDPESVIRVRVGHSRVGYTDVEQQ